VTLGIRFLSFLLLDVELAEKVERQYGVQVDDDTRQHERQDQLQHQKHVQHHHVVISIEMCGLAV